jgi:hypothetical protein
MGEGNDYNHTKSHLIDIENKTCSCGIWQDTELFCVHVMAYNRIIEKKSFKDILEMPLNPYYTYQLLSKLYKENIFPVIIDSLTSDNTTKPPIQSEKRPAGRPKTKREQKRRRSEITVTCSNCGIDGHNKKTCDKPIGYKMLKQLQNGQNNTIDDTMDNDDLFSECNVTSTKDNKTTMIKKNVRSERSFY